MHDREDDVQLAQRAGAARFDQLLFFLARDQRHVLVRAVQRDQRRVLGVEQVVGGVVDVPLPLFVDPQQRDIKLLFVDCIHNVFGRLQRHLMLRRFTAKNHPNT